MTLSSTGKALLWIVLALAWAAHADDGIVAYDLMGPLDRLAYDARSGGMGGAAVAVKGLESAPVSNAASLGLGERGDFSLGFYGESPAGPAGTANYFLAGTPDKAILPHHFERLRGWAAKLNGQVGYGELTVLGVIGRGPFVVFGTKGGIAYPTMTTTSTGGVDEITVVGPGIEYEDLGAAYSFGIADRVRGGIAIREIRFYRGQMDYTVRRDALGNITLPRDNTVIERGLRWGADVSLFYDGRRNWDWGLVLRHASAPRFQSNIGPNAWTMAPSLDLGAAWTSDDQRDLVAADIRNLFGANGGRPVLRIGWEHAFDSKGRWLGRVGLRDGRPTFGVGWRHSNGSLDLSFGPNPARRSSFSASFRF